MEFTSSKKELARLHEFSDRPFKVQYDPAGNDYLVRHVSSYEEDSSAERNTTFSNIRSTMKVMGASAMFLYGTPSTNVLALLARIYNQNMIRVMLSKHDSTSEPNEFNMKKTQYMYNMMTGVAEVDGMLYIAISEDPREDSKFKYKLLILYTLLRYANCIVRYDPAEVDEPTVPKGMGHRKGELFPTSPIAMEHAFSVKDLRMRENFRSKNNENINKFLLFANDETQHPSYNKMIEAPLVVTIIHSIKYLFTRRAPNSERGTPSLEKAMMYPPFKKSYVSGSSGTYACSNGSTCSESKIFSYLHDNIENFNVGRIQGYAAYWIGNGFPPFKHGIANYNYEVTDPTFKDIYMRVQQNMPIDIVSATSKQTLEYFVVPFALPCPGCFANYVPYTKNLKSLVDNGDCYHVNTASKLTGMMETRQSKQDIDQLNLSTSGPFNDLQSALKSSSSRSKQGGAPPPGRSRFKHTKKRTQVTKIKKRTRKHKQKHKLKGIHKNRTNKK
jgi:hypothetical protein